MLTPSILPRLQRALADAGLDGWLLFDFRGVNPVASGLLGVEGFVSRRIFGWLPREGAPVAVTHAIEQAPWARWPAEWERVVYSSWQQLEGHLGRLVAGKRVAMEYSPGDAVPYVDRVPAGVLEMVRAAGAEVVSSADLVSRFAAVWSDEELAAHRRAAEIIAGVARQGMRLAGERARGAAPLHEHELQRWIRDRFAEHGLETDADHGPIVAVDANAANPHYEPSAARPVPIRDGSVLLVDLWAKEPGGAWADQTWMASLGEPSPRAREVWAAVRDGRDAALDLLRRHIGAGQPVRGADADDAARQVIAARGFGDQFTHRTGHSIDASGLHGSGPHLDNLETREERRLVPGVGFSVEPGVYLTGEIGMRSEVNAWVGDGELLVTPADYQRELLVV
ncbi:MAG TPA: Xaa-Pro peptidase family protein [Gemmatimonadaceae bacterium]|nr:Xaa-Pro peptidase family protein [Gemmatimonadaceae bacterium]